MIAEKGVEEKWHLDSAAIGSWHVGNSPDQRCINKLKENNISTEHRARTVELDDFTKFDWIFGFDHDNISELTKKQKKVKKETKAKIALFGEYDPQKELIIEDPYYVGSASPWSCCFSNKGEIAGFDKCFEQCMRCCKAFLDANT
ncbi:unnamed protein product [Owenia fusiformis]|uniref:Low molecular weight phosphotyrosine protein phosphatase n=1 Tax=Owenia fusiformis TaxID=6347 RepID=A0A8S4NVH5_OWEFU|nr:unnamed protein product [Owenia fusiformis]